MYKSPIQRRNDIIVIKKRVRAKPYSQVVREGNQAYPVFNGLKNKQVEK